MGYACPVCENPQADAGHLANHLAFTAILGDEAHEAWLDEHAPGWAEMGEAELGSRLEGAVPETEFPQVFEDTAGGLAESDDPPEERSGALFDDGADGRGHVGGDGGHPDAPVGQPTGSMDEETRDILEEAREMTRAMLGADPDEDGADEERVDGEGADGESAEGENAGEKRATGEIPDGTGDRADGDGGANENG